LDAYSEEKRLTNCTFSKRYPWYLVSYDTGARAFVGSLSHETPKIVINSAGISCANGLYKLAPRPGGTKWRSLLAAAGLSTVSQFSSEALARPRGAGALKLEPSDVAKLMIPITYQGLSGDKAVETLHRADRLVRAKRMETARDYVDDVLLISPGIVTRRQLGELRAVVTEIRTRRLLKASKPIEQPK
jgi:hypothetical protein